MYKFNIFSSSLENIFFFASPCKLSSSSSYQISSSSVCSSYKSFWPSSLPNFRPLLRTRSLLLRFVLLTRVSGLPRFQRLFYLLLPAYRPVEPPARHVVDRLARHHVVSRARLLDVSRSDHSPQSFTESLPSLLVLHVGVFAPDKVEHLLQSRSF